MDFVTLQVVAIAVFSPALLALGALYLVSTPHVNLAAIALNMLTAIVGALRLTLNLPQSYLKLLTFIFVFFLVLALIADAQWGRKIWASKTKKPAGRRVEIESPNAWVVYKNPGESMAYRVPRPFLEHHPDYTSSDLKFRITCDTDVNPVDGKFAIDDKSQITLPADLITKLQKSQLIRFEIVE